MLLYLLQLYFHSLLLVSYCFRVSLSHADILYVPSVFIWKLACLFDNVSSSSPLDVVLLKRVFTALEALDGSVIVTFTSPI